MNFFSYFILKDIFDESLDISVWSMLHAISKPRSIYDFKGRKAVNPSNRVQFSFFCLRFRFFSRLFNANVEPKVVL